MGNKSYLSYYILLIGLLASSCQNQLSDNTHISLENDSIHFSSAKSHLINIKINNIEIYSKSVAQLNEAFIALVKASNADKRDIAQIASKNDNLLPIRVTIGESIDTIFTVGIEPYFPPEGKSSISGICAQLTSVFAHSDNSIDMKKWLFKRKEHLSEKQLKNAIGIYNELSKNKYTELNTAQNIPVIKSFAGLSYKVNSTNKADYYILYACSSPNEIEDFVSEIIANDFELCSNTLNQPLSCFRASDSNGYKCICLISINKDWKYSIEPLALVAIDNVAPSRESTDDKNVDQMIFPNDIKVLFPKIKPDIYGYADVSISNWDGNGLSCNCTFNIFHSGDVSKVVIHRIGSLAKWLSRQDKTIVLSEVSNPYRFTYELHFEDGDNLIPVSIYDNHGNVTDFELNVNAQFVRTDTHDINIDNNINIW